MISLIARAVIYGQLLMFVWDCLLVTRIYAMYLFAFIVLDHPFKHYRFEEVDHINN